MSRFSPVLFVAAILAAHPASSCAVMAEPHPANPAAGASAAGDARTRALYQLVQAIVAADYAGDRAALDRLYGEADAYLADPVVESRVRYWKGFAKWRRAINGANEDPAPDDLAADAEMAAAQLRRSGELDPSFVDARIGEFQCLGLTLFFDRERTASDERIARLRELMADLKERASDNPRYVWAWGMAYFTAPPEKGGGPQNVIAAYQKALDALRRGGDPVATPLDPTWGEAELCVNLAYSYLNQPSPDLEMARHYVDEAIKLVPTWHYARDILRPQIEAAAQRPGSGGGR